MSDYEILNKRIGDLEEFYRENTIELNYLDLLKTKTYFKESDIGTVLNSLNPYEAAIFQPVNDESIVNFADLVGIKKGDFVVKIRGGQFLKVDGPEVNTLYPVINNTDNTITWTTQELAEMPTLSPNPAQPPVGGSAQAIKLTWPFSTQSDLKYYPVVKFYNENAQEIVLYNNPTPYFTITGVPDDYTVTFSTAAFSTLPPTIISYAVIR